MILIRLIPSTSLAWSVAGTTSRTSSSKTQVGMLATLLTIITLATLKTQYPLATLISQRPLKVVKELSLDLSIPGLYQF